MTNQLAIATIISVVVAFAAPSRSVTTQRPSAKDRASAIEESPNNACGNSGEPCKYDDDCCSFTCLDNHTCR